MSEQNSRPQNSERPQRSRRPQGGPRRRRKLYFKMVDHHLIYQFLFCHSPQMG